MTAVVGILNKQAVPCQLDSAVTIVRTNDAKILTKANKVFTLQGSIP